LPRPGPDGDGRIIAVLVGRPKNITDDEWKQMEKDAVELIEREQKGFVFTENSSSAGRVPIRP
jgi:hypothetical protein